MGLDNIRIKNVKLEDLKVPWFVKLDDCPYSEQQEVEVCYWRKCWGIRDIFISKLHYEDGGETKVEVDDVPAIVKALEPFMSKSYWEEYADSIWEYDEYLFQQSLNLKNLLWLGQYMKENPDIEVYFYDSY